MGKKKRTKRICLSNGLSVASKSTLERRGGGHAMTLAEKEGLSPQRKRKRDKLSPF